MALQRCSVRDNLPNSWLIASLSSEPLLLANAVSYLLHLNYCASMETPQGLHCKGQELKTLQATGFLSVPELPLNSFSERSARFNGTLHI